MVEILEIPLFADKKRIIRKIRTKANGCGCPDHWILREPAKSSELMWLRAKDMDKKKGTRVPVRRVLYYLEYKELPLKQITMICGDKRCINPAHMRIRGFEREAGNKIERQIEKGWLRPEDAEIWFGWKNENKIKPPDAYDFDIGSLGD